MSKNPWAFKIDYDKAIADDETQIATYDSERARAISAELSDGDLVWIRGGYLFDAITFLVVDKDKFRSRLAIIGITEDEAREAAAWRWNTSVGEDMGTLTWIWAWIDAMPLTKGWVTRAEVTLKILDAIPVEPEEKRVAILKKARTDLARHKRNKVKFG